MALEAHGGAQNFGKGGGGDRYQRIRVPDPAGWKIETLKKGEDWHAWRDDLEVQIGTVWTGMNKVLVNVRDYDPTKHGKTACDKELFDELIRTHDLIGNHEHPADWDYKFVTAKLFMVIWKHLDISQRKIVQKVYSNNQCGFEAFRLLSKEYDPTSDDLASTLLERVTAVATWPVKGPAEELAALREVDIRLKDMERRLNRGRGTDEAPLHDATVTMVTGMLYARLISPTTKVYLMQKNKTCRSDFSVLLTLVEEFKVLQENSKPRKMDISSAAEPVYSHEEWVAYMESWYDGSEEYQEETYAPEAAEDPSLFALSKGKGKGGWQIKGKSKGKG